MDLKLRSTSDFKDLSLEESLQRLETSRDGLTQTEAIKRIAIFGYNEITKKSETLLMKFCSATGDHAVAV